MPKNLEAHGGDPDASEAEPLRGVYTSNLPALFDQLRISLVVSTYSYVLPDEVLAELARPSEE